MPFAVRASVAACLLSAVVLGASWPQPAVNVAVAASAQHSLVGYWHNFDSPVTGPTFPLGQIAADWDVVNVAYATHYADGKVGFGLNPAAGSPDEFIADISALKAASKKVVLSLGGPNGTLVLTNKANTENFVASIAALVDTYGFDGIDLSIERGLADTKTVSNLIAAVKHLKKTVGRSFYVNLSPSYASLQSAPALRRQRVVKSVASSPGMPLALVDGLRDELNLVLVRYFGSNTGLVYSDGRMLAEGSVDILVGGSLMLLERVQATSSGVKSNSLQPHQVGFGVAVGGSNHTDSSIVQRAWTCLVQRVDCDTIVPSKTYPDLGGIMGSSINLDAFYDYEFSSATRLVMDSSTSEDQAAAAPDDISTDGPFAALSSVLASSVKNNPVAHGRGNAPVVSPWTPKPSAFRVDNSPGNADGAIGSDNDKLVHQLGEKGKP